MRLVRFAVLPLLLFSHGVVEAAPITKSEILPRYQVIDPHTDDRKGTPGDFSFYLLTQEWVQEFCFHQPQLQDCSQPAVTVRKTLGLHGLWPQYKIPDDYPYNCRNSSGCPDGSVCMLGWSGLEKPTRSFLESAIPVNAQLLANHEWQKHGTCSGFNQQGYFETVQKLFDKIGTPEVISDNIGKSLSYDAIQDQYGYRVLLKCSEDAGLSYLDSIVSCWDKSLNQFACDTTGEENALNSCQGVTEIWIRQSVDRVPASENQLLR
ncbi:MAG: T2 family ribonuclease [Endozoicomonas sp.]